MSTARHKAWAELANAAKIFTNSTGHPDAPTLLSDAAKAWAKVNGYTQGGNGVVRGGGRQLRSGLTIPFGNSKGKPIEEATPKDLEFIANALRQSIDDPAKGRWREANEKLLDGIEKELQTR